MTFSTRQYSKTITIALLIVNVLFQSCGPNKIVRPEFLLESTQTKKDITVHTFDGRVFNFYRDDYEVVTRESSSSLKAKGWQYNSLTLSYDVYFEGELRFDEIDKIERHVKMPWDSLVPDIEIIIAIFLAIVIILIVLHNTTFDIPAPKIF